MTAQPHCVCHYKSKIQWLFMAFVFLYTGSMLHFNDLGLRHVYFLDPKQLAKCLSGVFFKRTLDHDHECVTKSGRYPNYTVVITIQSYDYRC